MIWYLDQQVGKPSTWSEGLVLKHRSKGVDLLVGFVKMALEPLFMELT